jgi:HK97 family phage major capsid protein
MNEKRLSEIRARKAEMREEVKRATTAEEITRLEGELADLQKEEAAVVAKLEILKELEDEGGGEGGGNDGEAAPMDDASRSRAVARRVGKSALEERARSLRQSRAITISSGELIAPIGNQRAVNGLMGTPVSSIADLVKVTNLPGMKSYKVPYLKDYAEGSITAENSEIAEDDTEFDYVELSAEKIAIYTEISSEAQNLTDVEYYGQVLEGVRVALKKKMVKLIASGDGQATPIVKGLGAAQAIDAATDATITAIDENTLRTIAMSYGGDENIIGAAVLFLNKKDLIKFGDIRGDDKKAVYEITPDVGNPNMGIIKDGGLSVRYCLLSALAGLDAAAEDDYIMFYGQPEAYQVALFSGVEVKVSEDAAFRRDMLAIRATVTMGGDVVVYNGFLRVKKGAAPAPGGDD